MVWEVFVPLRRAKRVAKGVVLMALETAAELRIVMLRMEVSAMDTNFPLIRSLSSMLRSSPLLTSSIKKSRDPKGKGILLTTWYCWNFLSGSCLLMDLLSSSPAISSFSPTLSRCFLTLSKLAPTVNLALISS